MQDAINVERNGHDKWNAGALGLSRRCKLKRKRNAGAHRLGQRCKMKHEHSAEIAGKIADAPEGKKVLGDRIVEVVPCRVKRAATSISARGYGSSG
jgi:hypothetical protein